MDTDESIAGIRSRLTAISDPKWELNETMHGDNYVSVAGRGMFGRVATVSTSPSDYGYANGVFIASAPEDIAYLLDLLEEKDKRIAELGG